MDYDDVDIDALLALEESLNEPCPDDFDVPVVAQPPISIPPSPPVISRRIATSVDTFFEDVDIVEGESLEAFASMLEHRSGTVGAFVRKYHLLPSLRHENLRDSVALNESIEVYFCIPRNPIFLSKVLQTRSMKPVVVDKDPYVPGTCCPRGLLDHDRSVSVLVLEHAPKEPNSPIISAFLLCMDTECLGGRWVLGKSVALVNCATQPRIMAAYSERCNKRKRDAKEDEEREERTRLLATRDRRIKGWILDLGKTKINPAQDLTLESLTMKPISCTNGIREAMFFTKVPYDYPHNIGCNSSEGANYYARLKYAKKWGSIELCVARKCSCFTSKRKLLSQERDDLMIADGLT